MKRSDRMILLGLVGVGLVAAFWMLALSPKRAEISELDGQIETAQASISEQEQIVATAEAAKADYDEQYQSLVVLGKAVPTDSDQASLVEQLNALAAGDGIDFDGLVLASDSGEAQTPPASAAETTTDESTTEADGTGESTETTTTTVAPAPPTEAAAASLPLGATVGPAGLPVMPYDLTFTGEFFEIADFMGSLDGMVKTRGNANDDLGVNGRLLTVDGFALSSDDSSGFPTLDANLHVTTYVAPADQGLTGGATPQEPAPATSVTSTSTTTPPVAAAGAVPAP